MHGFWDVTETGCPTCDLSIFLWEFLCRANRALSINESAEVLTRQANMDRARRSCWKTLKSSAIALDQKSTGVSSRLSHDCIPLHMFAIEKALSATFGKPRKFSTVKYCSQITTSETRCLNQPQQVAQVLRHPKWEPLGIFRPKHSRFLCPIVPLSHQGGSTNPAPRRFSTTPNDQEAMHIDHIHSFAELSSEIMKWENSSAPDSNRLVTIIQKLSRLGQPPADFPCKELLKQVSEHVSSIPFVDMCSVFYWACKNGVANNEFCETIARRVLKELDQGGGGIESVSNQPHLDGRNLLMVLYGTALLAKRERVGSVSGLGVYSVFPLQNRLVDVIGRRVAERGVLDGVNEQGLATCMYSFGLLGFRNQQSVNSVLSKVTGQEQLSLFSEQELVNVLQGVSLLTLGQHELLPALVSEIADQNRLGKYKEHEISSLIYNLGMVGYKGHRELSALAGEATKTDRLKSYKEFHIVNMLQGFSMSAFDQHDAYRALMKEVVYTTRLDEFSDQHLAAMVMVLGTRKFPDEKIVDNLVRAIIHPNRLERYDIKELISIVYGMSELNVQDTNILDRLSEEIAKPGRVEVLTDSQVYNILLAFANLQHNGGALVNLLVRRVLRQDRVDAMEPDTLAKLVYCFGKLKLDLSLDVSRMVQRIIEQDNLEKIPIRTYPMLLYGLGQMGRAAKTVVSPIMEAYVKQPRLSRFGAQDHAIAVYSMGQTGHADGPVLDKMMWEMTTEKILRKASNHSLSNTFYGLAQLQYLPKEGVLVALEDELDKEERVLKYTPQEIANLIHCFGLLKLHHRPGARRVTYRLSLAGTDDQKLGKFTCSELCSWLYGLCYLRFNKADVLTSLLTEVVMPDRLVEYTNEEISGIVYSLGQLSFAPVNLLSKLLGEASLESRLKLYETEQIVNMMHSLGKMEHNLEQDAIELLGEELVVSNRLSMLSEQMLTDVLSGLTFSKCFKGRALFRVLDEISRMYRRTQFTGSDVISIVKCLLHIKRHSSMHDMTEYMEMFVYELTRIGRIEEYTTRQLARVIGLLCGARNRNPKLAFPVLKEVVKPDKISALDAMDVSRIIWSLGPLGQTNPDKRPQLIVFGEAMLKQAMRHELGFRKLGSGHVCELVMGMGTLGLADHQALDAVAPYIPDKVGIYRPWQVVKILNGLGQVRYRNPDVVQPLVAEICRVHDQLDSNNWSDVMQAVLLLNIKDQRMLDLVNQQVNRTSRGEYVERRKRRMTRYD